MPQPTRRSSPREAALVELQRLHAAIQASRARRGLLPSDRTPTPEVLAARDLTRRLQGAAPAALEGEAPRTAGSRRGLWLLVAAAVLVAGVWAALTFGQRRAPSPQAAASGPGPATPGSTGTPAATGGAPAGTAATPSAPPQAAPAAVPQRPIRIALDTVREAWLQVTVDGKRAYRGTAAAGERLTFEADGAIVIRAGDAGAVRTTLNGADRGAMGLRGWPLTVSITPDGITPLTPTRPERAPDEE